MPICWDVVKISFLGRLPACWLGWADHDSRLPCSTWAHQALFLARALKCKDAWKWRRHNNKTLLLEQFSASGLGAVLSVVINKQATQDPMEYTLGNWGMNQLRPGCQHVVCGLNLAHKTTGLAHGAARFCLCLCWGWAVRSCARAQELEAVPVTASSPCLPLPSPASLRQCSFQQESTCARARQGRGGGREKQ